MAVKNYWWLIFWLFLFGGVCIVFFHEREEYVLGKRVTRWNWLPTLLLVLPYVLWAAGRTDAYGDTGVYRALFQEMPTGLGNLLPYLSTHRKGLLFVFCEYIFKTLISQSSVVFFGVLAAVQLFLLASVYRKFSRNYWMSIFLFVASTDYMSWMHNGVRQFLAVTVIFAALPLLVRRRYYLMCLVVLLATWIHTSAIIFLPFIFVVNGRAWNMRTLIYIACCIVAVAFIDKVSDFIVNSMENTQYEGDIEIFLNDDGTNLLRVLFYSVPALMAWLFRPYIDRANDPMINTCVNLSIVSAGIYVFSFFTSGILVGALPIYFSLANYILIPWLISEVFDPASAVLMDTGFVGVYTLFYYLQMQTWKLL